jgi:hypothetical protein
MLISDRPTPRAGSHQDHFQSHDYSNQDNMHSNYVKYPLAWQTADELAPFPVVPDSLQSIPGQVSPIVYGPLEKTLYGVAPYSSIHSLDNQSGTGRPSDDSFDSYHYLDEEGFIHYEGDPNQVSRPWLS